MTATAEMIDKDIGTEYSLADAIETYDVANRLTSFGDLTVLHDKNGNMTQWGNKSYVRDARNRLIEVKEGGSTIATFKYDAMGRRIEKTFYDGETSITTKYLYDGADIVLEMNGSDVATAYYIHGPGMDEPLARVELNTDGTFKSMRFYLADALGSIIALTDENGVVKTQYNYTPFGEVDVTGESSDNPFQFAGREHDEGTGLLFERNRYYSPILGRYIKEDPIRFAGGDINFYVRVGNNPVNFTDPLGLFSAKGLAGVIVGGVGVVLRSPPLIIIGGGLIIWDWYDSSQQAKKKGQELAEQLEKLEKSKQDTIRELLEEEQQFNILNTPQGDIQNGCESGK